MAAAAACLLAGCGGGGGGGGGAGGGTLEIRIVGGEGTVGNGGTGGRLSIIGVRGGDVRVLASGGIDPVPEPPALRPRLGSSPRTISGQEMFRPDPAGTITADDVTATATGLRILPDATLTLQPNTLGTDSVLIAFSDGVVIEGTLRIAPRESGTVTGTADLSLAAGGMRIEATGRIDGSGADATAAGANGADGGGFNIICAGAFVHLGTIDTSGGAGDAGGGGGIVSVDADPPSSSEPRSVADVWSAGTIDASGGRGLGGPGGRAGVAVLVAREGGVFHTGTILARGGDGTGPGGDGGFIVLSEEEGPGVVASSGTLDASGGHGGTGGGRAGNLELIARGGMQIGGRILARGGDAIGAGDGGAGGEALFRAQDGDVSTSTELVGGIFVSADIDASGGRGASGGNAGRVAVDPALSDQPVLISPELIIPGRAPVVFAGYRLIDVSGGRGAVDGGSALRRSPVDAVVISAMLPPPGGPSFVGSVLNEVPIVGRGGEGTTGRGGSGASVGIGTDPLATGPSFERSAENRGAIDVRGGAGAGDGGPGGAFGLVNHFLAVNRAPVDVSGGDAGTGRGGAGGFVFIASDGVARNEAPLGAEGGRSEGGVGGDGGVAVLISTSTRTAGEILCRGGNGVLGGSGGAGRVEGFEGIVILSTEGPSAISGTFGARGGRGTAADGADGRISIDGIDVETADGEARF